MLLISIFAFTFQPWEPCMSNVMLELIDVLNKVSNNEKKRTELNGWILDRERIFEKIQGENLQTNFDTVQSNTEKTLANQMRV